MTGRFTSSWTSIWLRQTCCWTFTLILGIIQDGADTMLFCLRLARTILPETNQQVLDLATQIREEAGVDVMIEQADMERNFIQNKGIIADCESHLIEVVEDKDPTPAMKAVANYALGVKANIPTALPQGAAVQMFTIKFNLTKNGKKTKLTVPEILELDLEEMGSYKYKGDLMVEDGFGSVYPWHASRSITTVPEKRNCRFLGQSAKSVF